MWESEKKKDNVGEKGADSRCQPGPDTNAKENLIVGWWFKTKWMFHLNLKNLWTDAKASKRGFFGGGGVPFVCYIFILLNVILIFEKFLWLCFIILLCVFFSFVFINFFINFSLFIFILQFWNVSFELTSPFSVCLFSKILSSNFFLFLPDFLHVPNAIFFSLFFYKSLLSHSLIFLFTSYS